MKSLWNSYEIPINPYEIPMKFLWLLVNLRGPGPGAAPSNALGEGHGAHGRGDRGTAGTPFDGVVSQRGGLPSGIQKTMERSTIFNDPLFLWPFSIAMFVYQRGTGWGPRSVAFRSFSCCLLLISMVYCRYFTNYFVEFTSERSHEFQGVSKMVTNL
jgi:hypothetical protein